MARRLILGDIHGAYQALLQVLDRANYHESDELYFVGDAVDGWPESREVIDFLLDNCNGAAEGNHDHWLINWLNGSLPEPIWTDQGGNATLESFLGYHSLYSIVPDDLRKEYRARVTDFFSPYIELEGNILIVHAGLPNHTMKAEGQDRSAMQWTRAFWMKAKRLATNDRPYTPYDKVFIGHTSTIKKSLDPIYASGVWNIDQGAGWAGRLTCMDIDTEEFWSSDLSIDLYPGVERRT